MVITRVALDLPLRLSQEEEAAAPAQGKLARVVAGERAPPGGFVKSIPRVLTPTELALQLMDENDPGALSVYDWVLILRYRDSTPANHKAADRLWQTIVDKQRGGGQYGAGTRIKLAVKVISAAPDAIEAAITDEAQAGNVADLHIVMTQPLAPLPAAGSKIAIIGTLSDYRPQPFLFTMTGAELAPESMPVAGGPCADPRPQMCTRDYRPACGRRRDGSRLRDALDRADEGHEVGLAHDLQFTFRGTTDRRLVEPDQRGAAIGLAQRARMQHVRGQHVVHIGRARHEG